MSRIRIGIAFSQNGTYRRHLGRVRNRTVGEVPREIQGCILMRFLFRCAHTSVQASYTSWVSRRDAHGGERLSAAGWLTCRFIDEFSHTFVRQDFNTIEGFRHCCPRGETSSRCVHRMCRWQGGSAIWYCNSNFTSILTSIWVSYDLTDPNSHPLKMPLVLIL